MVCKESKNSFHIKEICILLVHINDVSKLSSFKLFLPVKLPLIYQFGKCREEENKIESMGCIFSLIYILLFLNLPVWANFYGLTDLSCSSTSTTTTLDKPAILG